MRMGLSSVLCVLVVICALAVPALAGGRAEPSPKRAEQIPVRPAVRPSQVAAFDTATIAAVRAEADWILTAQLPDGAIANHTDRTAIWPYLSNYAAIGLARASAVTGDPRYVSAAWGWLRWYQAHETREGFVADHKVAAGSEISTGDMDSTDAYAGTYLLAVWNAYNVRHDVRALRALRPGIGGALRAIQATTDTDGLTWAKPTWRVKYLMDQAETYAGLRAGARILSVLRDPRAAQAVSQAKRMQAAVGTLWNDETGSFDWAVHDGRARAGTNWSKLYPDALQQAWAVAFGLADSARATDLLRRLTAAHAAWDDPHASDQPDATSYWPIVAWAFQDVGDHTTAVSAKERMRAVALGMSRGWPYTPATAGQLIVLLTGGHVTASSR